MRQPDLPPTLVPLRRGIVAALVVTAAVAVAVSAHEGTVAGRWTNTLGVLLGSLAGTYIGEYLQRFGGRRAATSIGWIKMALVVVFFVAILSWQSLPAYCQLPATFALGIILVAATVYIQRLQTPLS